jgi:hypothetical protein
LFEKIRAIRFPKKESPASFVGNNSNRLEGLKPYPLPTASKKVRSTATFVENGIKNLFGGA